MALTAESVPVFSLQFTSRTLNMFDKFLNKYYVLFKPTCRQIKVILDK